MNFSHNYLKLENKIFTMISKEPLKMGDIEPIVCKKKELFKAKVYHCEEVILDELPLSFLLADTINYDMLIETREDVYSLFQSFYRNKLDFKKQIWFLILLVRCK